MIEYPISKPENCSFTIDNNEYNYDELRNLKNKLNETKHQIDTKDGKKWNQVVYTTYKYNDLRMSSGILQTKYNAEIVTNAWLKIYELSDKYIGDYIQTKMQRKNKNGKPLPYKNLCTFHVAEAPGAFILAINHLLRTKYQFIKWNWFAESYKGTGRGSTSKYLKDEYGIIKNFPNNWYFGANGDGDLTDSENLRSFQHFMQMQCDGVDIYTGDGKAPTFGYDNEDLDNAKLYFAQVLLGLMTLHEGGVMIVKTFDHLEASTISILYMVSCYFDKTYITKPLTSKPGNSEVYIVGVDFKSITDKEINKFLNILDNFNGKSGLFRQNIPENFINSVLEYEQSAIEKQIIEINKHVEDYNLHDINKLQKNYETIREEGTKEWLEKTKFVKLENEFKMMKIKGDFEILEENKYGDAESSHKYKKFSFHEDTAINTTFEKYWNKILLDKPIPKDFIDVFKEWSKKVDITKLGINKIELTKKLLEYKNKINEIDNEEFKKSYISWCNPHIIQVFTQPDYSYHDNLKFIRILDDSIPRVVYYRRTSEVKSTIHWGQRKLLMSEIEFLSLLPSKSYLVTYAGSAPGTHIPYLEKLFPKLKWFLVDPAPFSCQENENVIIRRTLFTDETCNDVIQMAKEKNLDVLLISDIRSADPFSGISEEEVESKVVFDMKLQMDWHLKIKPLLSMFKFRLPWTEGLTDYLEGEIYLPVWGPVSTTETRLVIKRDALMIKYNNKKYEEQLFYFNTILRPAVFDLHDVGSNNCLDHCYDCMTELTILTNYLNHIKYDKEKIPTRILEMSKEISQKLTKNRTLCDFNPDPKQRSENIRKKQYIEGLPAIEYAKLKKGKYDDNDTDNDE
jgi:hypothetical protein